MQKAKVTPLKSPEKSGMNSELKAYGRNENSVVSLYNPKI
jgi:hypothetical protein